MRFMRRVIDRAQPKWKPKRAILFRFQAQQRFQIRGLKLENSVELLMKRGFN